MGESTQEVNLDDLFRVLADARRRRCLAYLRAAEQGVSVAELGAHIAETEGGDGETVSVPERRQVTTSLYHVHLPKLIDAGLVAWDDPTERSTVTVTDAGQTLATELSWL